MEVEKTFFVGLGRAFASRAKSHYPTFLDSWALYSNSYSFFKLNLERKFTPEQMEWMWEGWNNE